MADLQKTLERSREEAKREHEEAADKAKRCVPSLGAKNNGGMGKGLRLFILVLHFLVLVIIAFAAY